MVKNYGLLVCLIGCSPALLGPSVTVNGGFIREKGSIELLSGVNVFATGTGLGIASNNDGFYSLSLPGSDSVTLIYSFVGYERKRVSISASENTGTSFGKRLIKSLTRQADGQLAVSGMASTRFLLIFPLAKVMAVKESQLIA